MGIDDGCKLDFTKVDTITASSVVGDAGGSPWATEPWWMVLIGRISRAANEIRNRLDDSWTLAHALLSNKNHELFISTRLLVHDV